MGGSVDTLLATWIIAIFYFLGAGIFLHWLWRWSQKLSATPSAIQLAFRCARCGYRLRGIDSPNCPECGTPRGDHTAALEWRAVRAVEHSRGHYERHITYRPALPSDFKGLDRTVYAATTEDLIERGYRLAGDRVVEGGDTVQRIMLSPDGSTSVVMYEIPPRQANPGSRQESHLLIHAQSELRDGRFLETINARNVWSQSLPPEILCDDLPPDTGLTEILQRHECRRGLISKVPGADFVSCASAEDVVAAQQREHELEQAFRRRIGYADPEEYRRLTLSQGESPAFADDFAKAIDKARQELMPGLSAYETADGAPKTNSSAPSAVQT